MLTPNTDLQSFFTRHAATSRWKILQKPVTWAVLVTILLLGSIYWWSTSGTTSKTTYTTAIAKHGDLTIVVSATGTVEPVNEVTVSSELSGTIAAVNVDFDDPVKAGQVLAVINTDKLTAQINSARAELEAARAAVTQAEATVTETSQTLKRDQVLLDLNHTPQHDFDTAKAAYDRAIAARDGAKAEVDVKAANVAALESDLARADIKSPINGVVLDRKVDPGTTVAASLAAPTLFTIAEDLKQMRVLVDVDEADAGSVSAGQDATFTVEAYPERTFNAKVAELRYASKTTNNVVTYTGVLLVDNSDMAIRPGMTATADIIVKHEKNALVIPNAALRYAPATVTETSSGNWLQNLMPHPPQQTRNDADKDVPVGKKRIWVLRNGEPQPVIITTGSSDGTWTVVKDGDLADGNAVITDATTSQ
jgi:HlyD family secretion protein